MGGRGLPTGTVTFLFSDIEGSTRLLQELGDGYEGALAAHRKILRRAFDAHDGHEMGTEGDSFFVAFGRATDAVAAALEGQLALGEHDWSGAAIRVRMGVHTGEAQLVEDDYLGLAVHQAARISSAAHGGQVLVSQTTREIVGSAMPSGASLVDLGEHRLKDLAQPTRLYNLAHSGLQAELPPPRTLSVLPNNLPLQLTTFVGREEEIARIVKLLDSTRLLSLIGAGGSGKTRLALQVAADLVTELRSGVWLADLAPIVDPDLVMRGFAEALGVREEKDRTIDDVLIEYLQGKELLVVVDNCEHLAEASAEVCDRLLHAASGLRIVATSREPLGAQGETVFRVPSLDTPKSDEPPEALAGYESVRLFCDRAARAKDEFSLTTENAHAITDICRRLDGMPLAIELAAARVRMITPQEIAKRLDDRFKLLTGGLRTGIRRQQTLRATVDWSYEMLSEAERHLFRRLSVFVGGFTLEAAEGICTGEGIEGVEVFDLLSALVDRSLVLAEPNEETTRYRLLETMREYGREALAASGEASSVWSRHLTWFADLAEEAQAGLEMSDEPKWLNKLDTELENIRQALSWAAAGGEPLEGLRLSASLYKYWQVRWYLAEGLRWTQAAYEAVTDLPPYLHGRALVALGFLSMNIGRPADARPYEERCIALPRQPDTIRWIAEATNDLGLLVWFMDNDFERSRSLLEEALQMRREIGFRYGVRESLNNVAQSLLWVGDHEGATAMLRESLDLARETGSQAEVAFALGALANRHQHRGEYGKAREMFEEALAISQALGARSGVAQALLWLGTVERLTGNLRRSRALVEEAFDACRDREDTYGVQEATRSLAMIELEEGLYESARSRLEEVLKSAREVGSPYYIAMAKTNAANGARVTGELERARALNEEALETLDSGGEKSSIAVVWIRQAMVALYRGDSAEANRLVEEALAVPNAMEAYARTQAVHLLGLVRAAEGRNEEAAAHLREALEEQARLGLELLVIQSIEAIGCLAARSSGTVRAARLLGAAENLREGAGSAIYPVDRPAHEEAIASAKTDLGPDAFAAAWAEGRALSREEAVGLALEP